MADKPRARAQDVGLSRILTSDRTQMTSFQGTFEWAPPELINGGECSASADCYSFGVVLWRAPRAAAPQRAVPLLGRVSGPLLRTRRTGVTETGGRASGHTLLHRCTVLF